MTGAHYTRQQLFVLRNNIPMNRVIEALSIPVSLHDKQYRFCCPVCKKYHTGINQKTNLARCFSCEKNYNTIDLVMVVKNYNFLDNVTYLETLKADTKCPGPTSDSPTKTGKQNKICSIGEIFKSMASHESLPSTPSKKHETQTIIELQKRVSDLEYRVKALTEKIALIERA